MSLYQTIKTIYLKHIKTTDTICVFDFAANFVLVAKRLKPVFYFMEHTHNMPQSLVDELQELSVADVKLKCGHIWVSGKGLTWTDLEPTDMDLKSRRQLFGAKMGYLQPAVDIERYALWLIVDGDTTRLIFPEGISADLPTQHLDARLFLMQQFLNEPGVTVRLKHLEDPKTIRKAFAKYWDRPD